MVFELDFSIEPWNAGSILTNSRQTSPPLPIASFKIWVDVFEAQCEQYARKEAEADVEPSFAVDHVFMVF